MEPGIYEDIPNAVYHANRALGSTNLKTLATRTPAHFWHERHHPEDREEKDAFDLGTVVHAMILEGSEDGLVIVEANSWQTKDAREAKAEARAAGKTPLLLKDARRARRMRDAVLASPNGHAAFTNHRAEVSVFWQEDGLELKCRPDAWLADLLIDLKTTVNADPRSFPKLAYDLGYYQSAAHYIDGVKAVTGEELPFVFFLAEKTPPFLTAVVELDEDALAWGRRMNARAKDIFRRCTETGQWPGYQSPEYPLALPGWAAIQLQEKLA